VASVIVGTLVMLSLILAATTLFPSWDVTRMAEILAAILLASLVAVGGAQFRRQSAVSVSASTADRMTWRMPPLEELPRPVWSAIRKVGMITLRGYMVIAALLMIVKVVQLAVNGHA
jgi:hypothetical protein